MPYVLPTASNVELTSRILTVGESAGNGYRMVGIPDGLGAFANDSETFTLLMNHELANTRRHRALARLQGLLRLPVAGRPQDHARAGGHGPRRRTAGGLRLGRRGQEVQRRPGDAEPPLLRRPAGSERAVRRQQGHHGPHLPQRRGVLGRPRLGPHRHRRLRGPALAAAEARSHRLRERRRQPRQQGPDDRRRYGRRRAEPGANRRQLPVRGLHLRRQQDDRPQPGRSRPA